MPELETMNTAEQQGRWAKPVRSLQLWSSSTPPGGVHGMSGYYATKAALRRLR